MLAKDRTSACPRWSTISKCLPGLVLWLALCGALFLSYRQVEHPDPSSMWPTWLNPLTSVLGFVAVWHMYSTAHGSFDTVKYYRTGSPVFPVTEMAVLLSRARSDWRPNTLLSCLGLDPYVYAPQGVYTAAHVIDYDPKCKSAFQIFSFPVSDVAPGHSHPEAAKIRNAGDRFLSDVARKAGRTVYSIQKSSRDVRSGVLGSLKHHWPKDTHSPEHIDPLPDRPFIKLTNVDYYLSKEDWVDLFALGHPIGIFTFLAARPCGSAHNVSWTCSENNELEMWVAGGAHYRHQLWDYNVDTVTSVTDGVQRTFMCERRFLTSEWGVVLLTPLSICHTTRPPSYPFARRKLVVLAVTGETQAEFGRSGSLTKKTVAAVTVQGHNPGTWLSSPGLLESVFIPESCVATVMAANDAAALRLSDVAYRIGPWFNTKVGLSSASALIYSCLPVRMSDRPPIWTEAEAAMTFVAPASTPDDAAVDPRAGGRTLTPPVLEGAVAPAKSRSNDIWCVNQRIEAIRNTKPIPREYSSFVEEFVTRISTVLTAFTPDMVNERQSKPAQRAGNAQVAAVAAGEMKADVEAFLKSELYNEPKDPRNISTLPPEHRLRYSAYTLALADHLKLCPWYAFGLDPKQTGEAVRALATHRSKLVETDFSRFDGTHSKDLYRVELDLLLRCFPSDKDEVTRLHSAMTEAKAKTKTGVRYEIQGTRLSGSADTSVMNTVVNALIAYVVNRVSGLSPDAAYDNLGLYAGDDGITPCNDVALYVEVVEKFGMKIKPLQREVGHPVSFLGRYYPRPLDSGDSVADLLRQLPKLSATTDRSAKPEVVLYNKARGFAITDPKTPVLRAWTKMIFRITGKQRERKDLQSYAAALGVQYECSLAEEVLMEEASRQLGIPVKDIHAYESALGRVQSLSEIPQLDCRAPDFSPVNLPDGARKPRQHLQHNEYKRCVKSDPKSPSPSPSVRPQPQPRNAKRSVAGSAKRA